MCSECDRSVYARGLCRKHYDQARHAGVLPVQSWSKGDPEGLFWQKVDRSAGRDSCWPWTGPIHGGRYGRVRRNGSLIYVHRYAYQVATGEELSSETEVDHRCHNTVCCNPAHLRVATHKQNMENLQGAVGVVGVRGVHMQGGKYLATVTHFGVKHYLGRFARLEDAEAAVVAKRNELFTHNDADREAV